MNSSPTRLDDPHKVRTVYRRQLKELITAGDQDGVRALLERQWPEPGWVIGGLISAAAKKCDREILLKLVQASSFKAMKVATKAMFKVREVWGLVALAEAGKRAGESAQLGPEMLNLVAKSNEVELMRDLVSVFEGCDGFDEMVSHTLGRATGHKSWDMYRYLIGLTPSAPGIKEGRLLLHDMVQCSTTPHDLVEQALAWPGPNLSNLKGELLIHAACYGCAEFMALLMKGGNMKNQYVAEAVVAAMASSHEEVAGLLVPLVSAKHLSEEFNRQMTQVHGTPNSTLDMAYLRRDLDQVGRYLDQDGLANWVQWFAHEELPLTQSRLREMKAGEIEPAGDTVPRRTRLRT